MKEELIKLRSYMIEFICDQCSVGESVEADLVQLSKVDRYIEQSIGTEEEMKQILAEYIA